MLLLLLLLVDRLHGRRLVVLLVVGGEASVAPGSMVAVAVSSSVVVVVVAVVGTAVGDDNKVDPYDTGPLPAMCSAAAAASLWYASNKDVKGVVVVVSTGWLSLLSCS